MPVAVEEPKRPRKLILCFDGTGNVFNGNPSDTNVVKIFDKLAREAPDQFHYYQTGIGTYDITATGVNKSLFGKFSSKVSAVLDQGFASSFDAHVIAGYKFLMRYYETGDKIYLFGFSRGAFTARFLARMIVTAGLLSRGNEEMAPVAYELYQQYEQAISDVETSGEQTTAEDSLFREAVAHVVPQKKTTDKIPNKADTFDPSRPLVQGEHGEPCQNHRSSSEKEKLKMLKAKLSAFRNTFCRCEWDPAMKAERGIKPYFLGMFDCVSSVKVLESGIGKTPRPVSVQGTADHVRHAVAIDERRVKFKAALLAQDKAESAAMRLKEDIVEVWFPGNHGDVGGGWPLPVPTKPRNLIQKWNDWWHNRFYGSAASTDAANDDFQMSDVPLHWMIQEIKAIGRREGEEPNAIKWSERCEGFERSFEKKKSQALSAKAHDTMSFGMGSKWTKTLFWKFMEWLPLLGRWEVDSTKSESPFYYEWFWPNRGSTRDIPPGAVFHDSVVSRLSDQAANYRPKNNRGSGPEESKPCLTGADALQPFVESKAVSTSSARPEDLHHRTYKLKSDVQSKQNGTR